MPPSKWDIARGFSNYMVRLRRNPVDYDLGSWGEVEKAAVEYMDTGRSNPKLKEDYDEYEIKMGWAEPWRPLSEEEEALSREEDIKDQKYVDEVNKYWDSPEGIAKLEQVPGERKWVKKKPKGILGRIKGIYEEEYGWEDSSR